MPKKDIHPKWYTDTKVYCDGQLVMTVGSTSGKVTLTTSFSSNEGYSSVSTSRYASTRVESERNASLNANKYDG